MDSDWTQLNQEQCNERVMNQLKKLKLIKEHSTIKTEIDSKWKKYRFVVESYMEEEGPLFASHLVLDKNRYSALLENSFAEEGAFVREIKYQITGENAFRTKLFIVPSYGYTYEKKRG